MLYRDQNDETLVMLTLAGEQRAYEVLVLRYESAVIAAANSVLHSRYMAEDAAQDAFITAWMKLNILQEPKKCLPYRQKLREKHGSAAAQLPQLRHSRKCAV